MHTITHINIDKFFFWKIKIYKNILLPPIENRNPYGLICTHIKSFENKITFE